MLQVVELTNVFTVASEELDEDEDTELLLEDEDTELLELDEYRYGLQKLPAYMSGLMHSEISVAVGLLAFV
jgi:hypothetical protein